MKRIWFRDARKRAGLTQEKLAATIAKRQDYIAKLERGIIEEPGYSVGLALASELGIDPYALRFGRREDAA